MKDATDCALYLTRVRAGEEWGRFDVAVDDFLVRHKDESSTGTLRKALADAYLIAAPGDRAGHQRILEGT